MARRVLVIRIPGRAPDPEIVAVGMDARGAVAVGGVGLRGIRVWRRPGAAVAVPGVVGEGRRGARDRDLVLDVQHRVVGARGGVGAVGAEVEEGEERGC